MLLGSKASRASDGLSSAEIRLGNGVIVSCVAIFLTLHASQVIHVYWLFFFWMLLQYSNLFLLIWLRHIIFISNAKVCIFVVGCWCFDLYLIRQFGLYLEFCL